jgi:hypothetical protein
MTATPTFRTGTSFTLNGKVCRVWRTTRGGTVDYAAATPGEEPTFHTAKRATLVNFVAAGLIASI